MTCTTLIFVLYPEYNKLYRFTCAYTRRWVDMFHLEIIGFRGAISDSAQARLTAFDQFLTRGHGDTSGANQFSDSLLSRSNQG